MISNFSGGMNAKTNPILLRDTQMELIVNYHLDHVGSLTKRNGYDVFATQPVAGKQVHGLYQYTNTVTSAETTQVMVVNNSGNTQSVIYYNNSGTWATSKTNDTAVSSFTNFNKARFATFLDYLFRVNGQDVVATSNNVDGSVWGTTNAPATIIPSFIAVFQDRVYVSNNRQSSPSRYGSRVYYSSLPSTDATPVITWTTASDYFNVNPDDGDEITALENNGNRLLIFKKFSLYRWAWGQIEPDRVIGIGTESQECVKTNYDLGITFFANSKGVYAYTGNRPKLISRKIQKWIDAVPAGNWDDAAAEVDDDHYFLYLGDSLTVSGEADNGDSRIFTNVMAVYTISLDAWTIYTLNTPWRVAGRLILSSAEGVYFGSSNGRTYQWDSGLDDDSGGASGNTAVAINAEARSKEYLLAHPSKTVFEYFNTIADNALGTIALYQLNRKNNFEVLGNLKERFSYFKHIGKECHSVRFKLSDITSIASRIDGYTIEHAPVDER